MEHTHQSAQSSANAVFREEVCMIDTPEGIASQKWSFQVDGESGELTLSQGAIRLAKLTKTGETFKLLLVTCPQLWNAANDVVLLATKIADKNGEQVHPEIKLLGEMVAKAVGKQDWRTVLQS